MGHVPHRAIAMIREILADARVASGVSAATTGTGLGTLLAWIPDDIGKLAACVGIVLSLVLIYVHYLSARKLKIQIKILQSQAPQIDLDLEP